MNSSTAPRNFRPFWRNSVLMLSAIAAFPAFAGPGAIQAGDLSLMFDRAQTAAQRQRLLTLKDLNLSPADLTAILAHSRGRLKIQRELDLERPLEPGEEPEDEDRARDLKANPILDTACLTKMENWKVAAIRIAPFEYSLPGSKSVLNEFARRRQLGSLDRVFQVRFTLNPVCDVKKSDGTVDTQFVDVGLHVVFNVMPTDAGLRNSVLAPLRAFLLKNEEKKFAAAQADLDLHLKALTSPEYAAFHRQTMAQLETLARSRGQSPAATGGLAKLYDDAKASTLFYLSTHRDGEPLTLPAREESHSAPLAWAGDVFANAAYFAALKTFVAQTARRVDLERVAVNFLSGGDSWTLAGLVPVTAFREGVFAKNSVEPAKAVFASLFPQELKTVQAVIGSNHRDLSIQKISSANYYAMLGILPEQNPKQFRKGVEIVDRKLFGQVDFYAAPSENEDDESGFLRPRPSGQERIPLSRLLNSPEKINATTTSCTTCHVAPVITGAGNAKDGFTEQIVSADGLEPQQDVRIMGFDRSEGFPVIRAMVVNEVAADLKKVEAYLK